MKREWRLRPFLLWIRAALTPSPEGELYDSCITLKNLALMRKNHPMSADAVYECLLHHAVRLRPAYAGMLTLYRSGRDAEAFAFFADSIGTKAGKNFASILAKIDHLNPAELIEQMQVFQSMMAEKRVTQAMKQVQIHSLLTTLWASATIFALLINFTVVVVFLDTLAKLQAIF